MTGAARPVLQRRDATAHRIRMTLRERETLDRAQSGDPDAFIELIRPFDREHRSLAYGILGDRHRMDDALQEAYLKAYRGLPRFDGRAAIGTWLYRIVYNACLDELRRGGRVVHLPLDNVSHLTSSHDPISAAGSRDGLAVALRSLPPELRAVVLLVHAEGLDYHTVSEALGIPVGTVASRLHRARAALRAALDGDAADSLD
jgi:RNA polymerase sigma-70 factor, ECF subfamily